MSVGACVCPLEVLRLVNKASIDRSFASHATRPLAETKVYVVLLLCGCAATPPATTGAKGVANELSAIASIDCGQSYDDVVAQLGPARRDLGSGVYILEYAIKPAGYSVIVFSPANRVRDVLTVWSSDVLKTLPTHFDPAWLGADSRAVSEFIGTERDLDTDPVTVSVVAGIGSAITRSPEGRNEHMREVVLRVVPNGKALVTYQGDQIVRMECVWRLGCCER